MCIRDSTLGLNTQNAMTRRLRLVCSDAQLLTHQSIEQRGLTHIGPTGNGYNTTRGHRGKFMGIEKRVIGDGLPCALLLLESKESIAAESPSLLALLRQMLMHRFEHESGGSLLGFTAAGIGGSDRQ